jgi:hypothetical protein
MLIGLMCAACARAGTPREVVIHLHTGDRISGLIVREDAHELVLSNAWNSNISIPLSQVSSRENPFKTSSGESLAGSFVITNAGNTAKTNQLHKSDPPSQSNNSIWANWVGEASVGANFENGAKNHHDYYGHLKLTYSHPYHRDNKEFFRNIFGYDIQNGKTLSTLSDDRMNGSSKTDVDLTRKYYAYNLGSAGYDKVRLINARYEDGPGFGYHWITRDIFQANLEFGANYQVEERADYTRDESFFLRFGEETTWKLNQQMKFTEKAEYFQRSGFATQFRVRFESTLSYALILNLSLNFTAADIYDSNPAQTVPDNDFQLRTSLGVKF